MMINGARQADMSLNLKYLYNHNRAYSLHFYYNISLDQHECTIAIIPLICITVYVQIVTILAYGHLSELSWESLQPYVQFISNYYFWNSKMLLCFFVSHSPSKVILPYVSYQKTMIYDLISAWNVVTFPTCLLWQKSFIFLWPPWVQLIQLIQLSTAEDSWLSRAKLPLDVEHEQENKVWMSIMHLWVSTIYYNFTFTIYQKKVRILLFPFNKMHWKLVWAHSTQVFSTAQNEYLHQHRWL